MRIDAWTHFFPKRFFDKLQELYGFEPPRHEGLTTVKACEKMITGEVKAFIALGGNMVRAAPDLPRATAEPSS